MVTPANIAKLSVAKPRPRVIFLKARISLRSMRCSERRWASEVNPRLLTQWGGVGAARLNPPYKTWHQRIDIDNRG